MSDHEADFASLWIAYGEGRISHDDWQRELAERPGFRTWLRQRRECEMQAAKKDAAREAGWR